MGKVSPSEGAGTPSCEIGHQEGELQRVQKLDQDTLEAGLLGR